MNRPAKLIARMLFHGFAGWSGCVLLTSAWHALGLVSPTVHAGYRSAYSASYELTQVFAHCVSVPFGIAYAAVGVVLGWVLRMRWPAALGHEPLRTAAITQISPIALGMISPLPIALVIEVVRDPTSHNLFPFEVLLYWIPGFAIAFAGAATGWLLGGRRRDGTLATRRVGG